MFTLKGLNFKAILLQISFVSRVKLNQLLLTVGVVPPGTPGERPIRLLVSGGANSVLSAPWVCPQPTDNTALNWGLSP